MSHDTFIEPYYTAALCPGCSGTGTRRIEPALVSGGQRLPGLCALCQGAGSLPPRRQAEAGETGCAHCHAILNSRELASGWCAACIERTASEAWDEWLALEESEALMVPAYLRKGRAA